MQAHHLIPEEIWGKHSVFFTKIGMGGKMDSADNGLLMPDSEKKAKSMKRKFYHCSNHGLYSAMIDRRVTSIEDEYKNNLITADEAKKKIGNLQTVSRRLLSTSSSGDPVRLR